MGKSRDDSRSPRRSPDDDATLSVNITNLQAPDDDGIGGDAREAAEETWFEPDELVRLTHVEVAEGGGLLQPLRIDGSTTRREYGVDLRVLPGWPDAPACGAGLGGLGRAMGEIRSGDVVAVDAGSRGALADALALQLAEAVALAPTRPRWRSVICHGAGTDDHRRRLTARWSGQTLREVRAAEGVRDIPRALEIATEAWSTHLRQVPARVVAGHDLLDQLTHDVQRWCEGQDGHQDGTALCAAWTGLRVWHREAPGLRVRDGESEATGAGLHRWIFRLLETVQRQGWITFVSVQTADERAAVHAASCAGLLRGTLELRGADAVATDDAPESLGARWTDVRDGAAAFEADGLVWSPRMGRVEWRDGEGRSGA